MVTGYWLDFPRAVLAAHLKVEHDRSGDLAAGVFNRESDSRLAVNYAPAWVALRRLGVSETIMAYSPRCEESHLLPDSMNRKDAEPQRFAGNLSWLLLADRSQFVTGSRQTINLPTIA